VPASLHRSFGYGRGRYGNAEYGRGIDQGFYLILFNSDGTSTAIFDVEQHGVQYLQFGADSIADAVFAIVGGTSAGLIAFLAGNKTKNWIFLQQGLIDPDCITGTGNAPVGTSPNLANLYDAPASY